MTYLTFGVVYPMLFRNFFKTLSNFESLLLFLTQF